jgi:hypothetical protein
MRDLAVSSLATALGRRLKKLSMPDILNAPGFTSLTRSALTGEEDSLPN